MLTARERHGWLGALLVVPAIVPFVWGPSAGAISYFVLLACVALLAAFAPLLRPAMAPQLLLGTTAAAIAIGCWAAGTQPWPPLACLLGILVCAGVGAACLQHRSVVDTMMLGLVVAAALNSIAGLLQYGGWGQHLTPWIYPAAAGEAMGNLRQRNQLATLANMGLVALWWFQAKGARAKGRAISTYAGLLPVAALLLVIANAASSSRTGLVQLVLLLATLALASRTGLRIALMLLASYLVAAVVLPEWQMQAGAQSVYARLGDLTPGCLSRRVLWSNVLQLIAQRPLLGWGWGELGYAHFATLYIGPRFCDILDNAHNLPLHLAVELGVPAALCIFGFFGWMVWRAKPWRERDSLRQAAWALLALILLHSMLEYPLWYGIFQMVLGLCLGLLWPNNAVTPRVVWCSRATALAIAICLVFAAVDYHRVGQLYLPPDARAPANRSLSPSNIGNTWLFRKQVLFAELTTLQVTAQNAQRMRLLAAQIVHFSPEPSVIEKGMESAAALGLENELKWYQARYQAAFPARLEAWLAKRPTPTSGGS